jgi:hypothetical protein
MPVNGHGQRKAIIIIGVLADDIHSTRRRRDPARAPPKLAMEFLSSG